MANGQYDMVIVGAGIGGLMVASYLCKNEGKRVLVLEKNGSVGGRGATVKGDEIRSKKDLLKTIGRASTKVVKVESGMEELVASGYLKGYSFDAGTHAITLADKGRLGFVMRDLGIPLKITSTTGAGFVYDGKIVDISRGFPWMGPEDYKALHVLTKEMMALSMDDMEKLDDVSLWEWLCKKTDNTVIRDFHGVMGSLNCSINDPALVSAGDYLKVTQQIVKEGATMSSGSVGFIDSSELAGYDHIAKQLAHVVETNGGKVVLDAPVREILVEKNCVKGVVYEQGGEEKKISASTVISNLPVTQVFSIVPEHHFSPDFVNKVKSFWASGAAFGIFGLKESFTDISGFVLNPSLIKADDLFQADVRGVAIQPSNFLPNRVPKGKHILEIGGFLTGEEAHEQEKVDRVCSAIMEFLKAQSPRFEETIEWGIFMCSDGICPVAESTGQVGDNRPDVKSSIEGLYFVGDTVRCWGGVVDAVAHSALLCMESLTEKDYLRILPEHQR
jgi:protoporphyrinogen oxidase